TPITTLPRPTSTRAISRCSKRTFGPASTYSSAAGFHSTPLRAHWPRTGKLARAGNAGAEVGMTDLRTAFARAYEGYDSAFKHQLTNKIAEAIMHASMVADANVCAIRTAETADALIGCLIAVPAMSPSMDVPAELRKTIDDFAKRLHHGVAQARAEGVGDIFGAQHGGHAWASHRSDNANS